MDLSDAPTVLAQLPAAFEHVNEIHPHLSLKMKSSRKFMRQRVEQLHRLNMNNRRYIAYRPYPESGERSTRKVTFAESGKTSTRLLASPNRDV